MVLSTIEYLYQNGNCVISGINFTKNDLVFLGENKLEELIINEGGSTEERMNVEQVIARLVDLFKLACATNAKSGVFNHEEYIENFKRASKLIENDFGFTINL